MELSAGRSWSSPLFEDHPLNQLVLNGSRGKPWQGDGSSRRQILVPLTKYFVITRIRGDVEQFLHRIYR